MHVYSFNKAFKGVGAANILRLELNKNKNKIKNKIINIIPAFLEGRRDKTSGMQTVHVRISLYKQSYLCRRLGFVPLRSQCLVLLIIYTLKIGFMWLGLKSRIEQKVKAVSEMQIYY